MKKKFGLWLNIVTICLCVCAIAIGVYAATSATLQVQGQIGFTAHGCDIDASGYVYGHKTTDSNSNEIPTAAPTQDSEKVKLTDAGADSTPNVAEVRGNTTETLDIGDRYFTDMNTNADGKPTDIVVVLTLTNQSLFDVYGVVSATSTNSSIGITKSVGLFNLDKKVDSTVDSIDITITLFVIPDASGNYNSIEMPTADNVHISIDFNKGKLEDNLLKKDTTNNYYYIEMGEYNSTPLKWYAFAHKSTEENATYGTAVNNYASGSYYFISEKVLLTTYSEDYGMYIGDNTLWGDYPHSGKLDDNYSLDYGTSKINPIVNGQDDGSVYDTYGMSTSPIYKAITNRDLAGETYTYYDYDVSPSTQTTYTTRTAYNQTLWLLSQEEAKAPFFAENADRKANAVNGTSSDYAYWWLRSPNYANSNGDAPVWCVNGNGYVNGCDVFIGEPGVRPAFQIDIAV